MRIEISVGEQKLVFTNRKTSLEYPVSTSKYGEGYTEGSMKTPLGMHEICEMIGDGQPYGMIFKDRDPTGIVADIGDGKKDIITTRIIRLKGLQKRNSTTFDRYIYIHGTNDESSIGTKASIGCIRMKNKDIIELFSHVRTGCKVYIHK
ncbi:MAG TPA: L,D-transpeptidase [Clostridiales bacterium]|mgnify:CR=1 FL=1|jgi:L,D-transpeptidase YbiS|nr:L,D-transpeptidase [Clostridiales bacterium]HQP69589.1 L,D-transpeptidase [Clostridiales bacterium]